MMVLYDLMKELQLRLKGDIDHMHMVSNAIEELRYERHGEERLKEIAIMMFGTKIEDVPWKDE